MHVLYEGYGVAARQLVANGYSISPAFLTERVEEIEGLSPHQRRVWNGSQSVLDSPLLHLIGAQKVDEAIPAMLELARRRPDLRWMVKETLESMGTPKAKDALRTVGTADAQPEQ